MIVQYLIGNEHLTSYDKMRDLFEYFPVNLEYEQKHHELELRGPTPNYNRQFRDKTWTGTTATEMKLNIEL